MSRNGLPAPLVTSLAAELGVISDGFPNWTDKSIQRFENLLGPHDAILARHLSTSGAIGTDGVVRMKLERSGRLRDVWFDPYAGLYDFVSFRHVHDGDSGLFDFVDFVWRGDGPRLGRAAVANRMAALLGRAFVRSVDVGCRWSWEIP